MPPTAIARSIQGRCIGSKNAVPPISSSTKGWRKKIAKLVSATMRTKRWGGRHKHGEEADHREGEHQFLEHHQLEALEGEEWLLHVVTLTAE
jgi:hypothetical protein